MNKRRCVEAGHHMLRAHELFRRKREEEVKATGGASSDLDDEMFMLFEALKELCTLQSVCARARCGECNLGGYRLLLCFNLIHPARM